MVIAIDAAKAFDQIQHTSIIKRHNKLKIEINVLNLQRASMKTHSYFTVYFPPEIRNLTKILLLSHLFSICTGGSSWGI